MPSVKSLEAGEYYAHMRNGFWKIMGEILSFSPSLPYGGRVRALERSGVALWDTLKFCEREGSLDSRIRPETETPNDVGGLLVENPSVRAVFFNGAKPEGVFNRRIGPFLDGGAKARLHMERLPSTSPANAGISGERKRALWERAIRPFL